MTTSKNFTLDQVAAMYATTKRTVLSWVKSGDLTAIDTSRKVASKKPRFRITQAALTAFEAKRTTCAPIPRATRRKRQGADTVDFFANC